MTVLKPDPGASYTGPMMRALKLWVAGSVLTGISVGACTCQPEDLNDLQPLVAVTPNPLDFRLRQVNADTTLPATLVNQGTAKLSVSRVYVDPQGSPFTVALVSETEPFVVLEKEETELNITFHPTVRGPSNAELVVESDDKDNPTYRMPLVGTGGPPRIQVLPDALSFDLVNQGTTQTRTVQITNVGLDTLHVTEVKLDAASNPGFRLAATNNFGSGDVEVNQFVQVRVEMAATVTGTATGTLHILSDADGTPDKAIPITATANLGPIVEVVEKITREADHRTDLYLSVTLDSSGTMDAEGDPYTVSWRVLERPPGSQSILEPTGIDAERSIYIDQVGLYRIEVTGTDSRGAVGSAIATLRAIRDLALRLTWEPLPASMCHQATVPEDACGKTDVDLHLVAPMGTVGDYFTGCAGQTSCSASCRPLAAGAVCASQGRDCAYANRNPDWGIPGDPDDDPRLDIDDAYGFGPENTSMNNPEPGDYQVQVHFCNDRLTYEGAIAQVEVFFHGEAAPTPVLGPVTLPAQGSLWLAGIVNYNPARTPKFMLTAFNTNPVIVDGPANLCTQ